MLIFLGMTFVDPLGHICLIKIHSYHIPSHEYALDHISLHWVIYTIQLIIVWNVRYISIVSFAFFYSLFFSWINPSMWIPLIGVKLSPVHIHGRVCDPIGLDQAKVGPILVKGRILWNLSINFSKWLLNNLNFWHSLKRENSRMNLWRKKVIEQISGILLLLLNPHSCYILYQFNKMVFLSDILLECWLSK